MEERERYDPNNQHKLAYFYCVLSEQSSILYNSVNHRESFILQPQWGLAHPNITNDTIESVLHHQGSEPSSFVPAFGTFAKALRRAYRLHCDGDAAVLVVRLDASALRKSTILNGDIGLDCVLPVWSDPLEDETWLYIPEVAPILGVNAICDNDPDWLACGNVSKARFSAAWPIIGSRLMFEQGIGEHIKQLASALCDDELEIESTATGHEIFIYDWEEQTFLEVMNEDFSEDATPQSSHSVSAGSFSGIAPNRSAALPFFNFAGYLRGMVVMD
ncbi:hypothetical protein ACN47E_003438 [Coniothyrium glycines]